MLTLVDGRQRELGPESLCHGLDLRQIGQGAVQYDPSAFLSYRQLRAQVYINERGFLTEDFRDEDGGEKLNADDDRSVHNAHVNKAGVAFGAVRFIIGGDKPLPAEKLFGLRPRAKEPFEISRFMALHPDPVVQTILSAELAGLSLAHANANDTDGLAVLERPFGVLLKRMGIVFDQLADPVKLEEYGDTFNMPIVLNVDASVDRALELDRKTNRALRIGAMWAHMVYGVHDEQLERAA